MLVAVVATMAPGVVRAQSKPIDVQHSRLIVFVGKAGVFSAFGDDHMIGAPISRGTISESGPLSIQLAVNAADLAVLDRDIDSGQREAIRARMIGKDVLDATRFPSITFESTSIEPAGQDRWNVAGSLTVHGITRRVTFSVVRSNDRYRGDTRIRQSDFGIAPIRIAGGTVKVKDELKIEFEIAASFTATGDATLNIYDIPSLGGEPRSVKRNARPCRCSPDGRWLTYTSVGPRRQLR